MATFDFNRIDTYYNLAKLCREALARNVRRLRKERGLTQARLGEAIAASSSQISNLERRDYGTLDTLKVLRLADVLSVPVDALFGRGASAWSAAGAPPPWLSEMVALLLRIPPEDRDNLRTLLTLLSGAGER